MIMAPMKSSCLCFAVGVVVLASSTNTAAAAAAASSRPGSSPVYSLQVRLRFECMMRRRMVVFTGIQANTTNNTTQQLQYQRLGRLCTASLPCRQTQAEQHRQPGRDSLRSCALIAYELRSVTGTGTYT